MAQEEEGKDRGETFQARSGSESGVCVGEGVTGFPEREFVSMVLACLGSDKALGVARV